MSIGKTIFRTEIFSPRKRVRKISHGFATMPREAELSLNERDFILQALQENIRLDGRALDAYRPLEITFGEDYGTADVQLGNTR